MHLATHDTKAPVVAPASRKGAGLRLYVYGTLALLILVAIPTIHDFVLLGDPRPRFDTRSYLFYPCYSPLYTSPLGVLKVQGANLILLLGSWNAAVWVVSNLRARRGEAITGVSVLVLLGIILATLFVALVELSYARE